MAIDLEQKLENMLNTYLSLVKQAADGGKSTVFVDGQDMKERIAELRAMIEGERDPVTYADFRRR